MKKLLLTSSFLILSSTVGATSVGGSIGGWNVVSQVANGIGQKLTATKNVMVNGASKVVTGTANLTPNPGNMARFMAKAGGAAVVINAVDLVLDGVDYVMDPANNTIRYNTKSSESWFNPSYPSIPYSTAEEACRLGSNFWKVTYRDHPISSNYPTGKDALCYNKSQLLTGSVNRRAYEESKPKTVPLSDVSSQVLDQAEEDIRVGNPASPAVALSRAVAQDMAAEAETDDVKARPIANQFEQTQSIPTDEDSTGTIDTPEVVDPITGEVVKPAESSSISMKWPKACEWFPSLCLFIDWMQKPHELDDPELPTKEIEKKEIDEELVKIKSSSCPAPIDVNIPLPVFNTTYTDSISVTDYCPKIEKLAPVLQLLAFVLAIMIIKDI